MRILITGIDGFLGRHLERRLQEHGHEVYGIDLTHAASANHRRCDIRDFRNLDLVFEWARPEVVYNLAAEFGRVNGDEFPYELWTSNCLGLRYVMQLCIKHSTYLVHASSSEAYGNLPCPQREDDLLSKVPKFHNEYALTKWANEKQLEIATQEGLRYSVARFFNVYGEGELYSPYRSVVCLFIYRLMKGLPITVYQGYRRTFLHVHDWANTMVALGTCHETGAFNIGSEAIYEIGALKDKIIGLLGCSKSQVDYLPRERANVTAKLPDMTRTRQFLGHKITVDLDEGLRRTVKWMRLTYHEGAELPVADHLTFVQLKAGHPPDLGSLLNYPERA
jgi:dTDP-glucose 4,6-dehydratase